MQALGDDDKASIEETIDDEVLRRHAIKFRSTAVELAPDGRRLNVQGELTLVGEVRPVAVDVTIDEDGRLTGTTVLKQSDWGITPYSTLFGALKVVDEVEVALEARLPASGPRHSP
jgi:polyisoprenoid-binding protein YceI